MTALTPQQPAADDQLWNLARSRAQFKVQLVRFVLVNLLLWAVWYFTSYQHHYATGHSFRGGLPWPAWVTLFWGLGLLTKGLTCYGFWGTQSWTEREYQQLLRDQQAGRH